MNQPSMKKEKNPAPPSRRRALKQLAALGSAAALSPTLFSFGKKTEDKLGVALVGLGNYASLQLGPALRQTKHCELRGIVTGTPENAALRRVPTVHPDGRLRPQHPRRHARAGLWRRGAD